MRTPVILLLVFSFGGRAGAQIPLDDYVAEGLRNNLVLQQKSIGLEKSLLALNVANGMFLPSVSLLGNFTTGDGGRSIAFPVGDLLNPVYSTLNALTGTSNFPQVENVNTNFFPREFYDVRARTSMPLFNTDLIYNRKIKSQQTLLQEYEVAIYKRELIKNIKTAYFNYLTAREGVSIYQSALARAQEGRRVNESLLANGKGLPAYVLRSQSEIENIQANLIQAERQVDNARLYFNFLLNREAVSEINSDYAAEEQIARATQALQEPTSGQSREELYQVKTATELNTQVLNLTRSFWSPRLSGFIDVGAQAENLQYNRQANYYLLGLQLEMPLFAGFTNRHKIAQAKLDVRNTELTYDQVTQQVNMAARMAKNALIASYQNYQSAQKQLEAAQSYQRLIEKGYKEGVNTFIEAIDARNQLTAAQLQVTVNQFNVLTALATLERETAALPLH